MANAATWCDPDGRGWIPDFHACKEPFLELVGDFAERLVWQRAAQGWCGKGLHGGVEWSGTLALYKHIALVNGRGEDKEDNAFAEEPCLEEQKEIWHENASAWLELFLTG